MSEKQHQKKRPWNLQEINIGTSNEFGHTDILPYSKPIIKNFLI